MICQHIGCDVSASTKCRMGDGVFRIAGQTKRQTFVRYCDEHFQDASALFVLCDVQPLLRLKSVMA